MNLYFPGGIFNISSSLKQSFQRLYFNYNTKILYKVRVLFSLMWLTPFDFYRDGSFFIHLPNLDKTACATLFTAMAHLVKRKLENSY